jgi:two-component system response regulator RegX3
VSLDQPRRDVVLLVEDEESFVDALIVGLGREGFQVIVARDGEEAVAKFDQVRPDLVLLDLMLPKMSGLEVCRALRAVSRAPIIMITAKTSEIDTIVGLEVGADDYVTKPYRLRELVARMRAVLRRTTSDEIQPSPDALIVGDLLLDADRHLVEVHGREVMLTLKEFELLHCLMERAGRVVTRETLFSTVWGFDWVGDPKTLDVHVKRLRQKIEDDPTKPKRITTLRGLGYRLEEVKR